MDTPAIRISNLRKRYPGFELQRVSFTLPRGYVMGLVGPNGAGKTTIIKLIMNLIRPDGGEIHVFGLDHRAHEAEIKARVGWVYDVPPFYGDVSLSTRSGTRASSRSWWPSSSFPWGRR